MVCTGALLPSSCTSLHVRRSGSVGCRQARLLGGQAQSPKAADHQTQPRLGGLASTVAEAPPCIAGRRPRSSPPPCEKLPAVTMQVHAYTRGAVIAAAEPAACTHVPGRPVGSFYRPTTSWVVPAGCTATVGRKSRSSALLRQAPGACGVSRFPLTMSGAFRILPSAQASIRTACACQGIPGGTGWAGCIGNVLPGEKNWLHRWHGGW